MINDYLKKLDDFIITSDEVLDVDVIRRSIWDTEVEKIGLYRYKIHLSDESLLELTERLVEEKGELKVTKYRFHWQTKEGNLIKRWDNARHHPEIKTFPHHLHEGTEENVRNHKEASGLDILFQVVREITSRS